MSVKGGAPSLYLQGGEGIEEGGGEVGLQSADAGVLQSEQQVEIEGISLTGHLPEGKDRSLTVPRSGLLPGVTWVSPGNLESEPPVEVCVT